MKLYVYKNGYADNYHVNNYDWSDRILCYPNVLDVGIVFPHQWMNSFELDSVMYLMCLKVIMHSWIIVLWESCEFQ